MEEYNYYTSQFERINTKSEYPASFQIVSGGSSDKTNYINLNKDSAAALISWLKANYIPKKPKESRPRKKSVDQLAKDLELDSYELAGYMASSFINGNFSQCKELFHELSQSGQTFILSEMPSYSNDATNFYRKLLY